MTSDIPHRTAKFICSQQMENSETKKRAISLAKAIVDDLALDPGVDTLSRWMAHYVAEQIATAENATADEKSVAEQKCFDTVLKLWQHHSSFPNGRRPFENFEPIFRALNAIDPANSRSYYFDNTVFQRSIDNNSRGPREAAVQSWINVALGLDRGARVLIDFTIRQAAHNAADETTASWIKNAAGVITDDELTLVTRLLSEDKNESSPEKVREHLQNDINSKIEKLNALLECGRTVHVALVNQLKTLSKRKYKAKTRS